MAKNNISKGEQKIIFTILTSIVVTQMASWVREDFLKNNYGGLFVVIFYVTYITIILILAALILRLSSKFSNIRF